MSLSVQILLTVSAIIAIFCQGVLPAQEPQAKEPLSLELHTSAIQALEIEPIYFSIRMVNRADHDVEFAEIFSARYGDVALFWRTDQRGSQWQRQLLHEQAGLVNIVRTRPHTIPAKRHLEVIECVVPGNFLSPLDKSVYELRAGCLRNKATMYSSSLKTTIVEASDQHRAEIGAVTTMIKDGARRELTPDEVKELTAAAEISKPIARALALCQDFRQLRKFQPNTGQPAALKEFGIRIAALPDLEREYWAYQFAHVHTVENERLVNRSDSEPADIQFHLDFCTALDGSLGTANRGAESIRNSCDFQRKVFAYRVELNAANKPSTPEPKKE